MTEDESATTRLVRGPAWNDPPLLLLSAEGTRVLVAGTGTHCPASRPAEAPAVAATVNDLGACLVERAGLSPAGLTVMLDPATPANLGESLERLAREATSVLVFHYVGHGLFSRDDELHLATRATVDLGEDAPGYQGRPGCWGWRWNERPGTSARARGCRSSGTSGSGTHPGSRTRRRAPRRRRGATRTRFERSAGHDQDTGARRGYRPDLPGPTLR
ncbi:hypothetical protein ABZ897_29405 [Nonomuraea sp. NPDC046802]|uniref:hypothetical protein n=1 Tax=Nonomuraea sp. NPDC046802 TaxID=3154919 RepID=UPI00340802D5